MTKIQEKFAKIAKNAFKVGDMVIFRNHSLYFQNENSYKTLIQGKAYEIKDICPLMNLIRVRNEEGMIIRVFPNRFEKVS